MNFFQPNIFLIWLLVSLTGSLNILAYEDYSEQEETPKCELSEQDAIKLITEEMSYRGLEPSQESRISIEDYTSSDIISSTRHVRIWINSEGEIIPSSDWRKANPDFCREQDRYMYGATKLLNIKLATCPNQATIQLTNVETGIIEQQQTGAGWEEYEGMAEAIHRAWNKMDLDNIKMSGSLCEKRFKKHFSFISKTTFFAPDGNLTVIDHVKADFDLNYHVDENIYSGTGALHYVDYKATLPSRNCLPPPDAIIDVLALNLSDGQESLESDTEMILRFRDFEPAPCPGGDYYIGFTPMLSAVWFNLHKDEIDWTATPPFKYIIRDWEKGPNSSNIIVRAFYNRTKTHRDGGNTVYSEETTIEISDK